MIEKIKYDANPFLYPMPVVIVGVNIEDRANFVTVSFISKVNINPPLIGIALNHKHLSTEGVDNYDTFSINIPGENLISEADYCGMVSGDFAKKEPLFDVFYGSLKTAPMISECPFNMECRLVERIELPKNYLYIGEVVNSYTEERFMTDGKPDIKKMNTYVVTMPDNRYWAIGDHIGDAWHEGKSLKKSNN